MASVLDRLIVSEPGFRGGRPRIADTRLTVADIALRHIRFGQTPVEIAGRFDVPLAAVYAALAFYFDHRPEIDADIAADEAFAAEYEVSHPDSLLTRVKLAAGD